MAHIHSVYDTEPHFQIDKTSREIKNVSNSKTTITQFDHNSERFTFEIPRFIDGHDMSLCNNVQVHYINIDSTDKTNKISGVYTVEDLQLSPEDEDIVICSWLISQNATQLAGSLAFLLRFACVTDDVLDYAWNTTKCTTISVSNGLYNGEAIIEEYFDILSVWEQNIIDDVTAGIDETIEEKVDNVKLVESASGKAITINPANAPIPYLKLSGETTQDGTELKSVGDSGSYSVDVYGKNLADIINGTKGSSGASNTYDETTHTITLNVDAPSDGTGRYFYPFENFEIGKAYTLSFDIKGTAGKNVRCGWNSKSYITITLTNQFTRYSMTLTATKNEEAIIFYSNKTAEGGLASGEYMQFANVQIEEGTEATPYEPFTKQSITFTDTLRGKGEVADEKDFARGVKIQRFGIVDLGTLNWYLGKNGDLFYTTLPQMKNFGVGLCEKYIVAQDNFNRDKILYRAYSYVPTALNIKDTDYTDAETLKADLSGTMLVYELETPIETPLSETELNAYRQLMTNSGTTTILSEADVDLLYYVNKPNAQVIGDIHTQINKDYLKLHAMLQSESQSEG